MIVNWILFSKKVVLRSEKGTWGRFHRLPYRSFALLRRRLEPSPCPFFLVLLEQSFCNRLTIVWLLFSNCLTTVQKCIASLFCLGCCLFTSHTVRLVAMRLHYNKHARGDDLFRMKHFGLDSWSVGLLVRD